MHKICKGPSKFVTWGSQGLSKSRVNGDLCFTVAFTFTVFQMEDEICDTDFICLTFVMFQLTTPLIEICAQARYNMVFFYEGREAVVLWLDKTLSSVRFTFRQP